MLKLAPVPTLAKARAVEGTLQSLHSKARNPAVNEVIMGIHVATRDVPPLEIVSRDPVGTDQGSRLDTLRRGRAGLLEGGGVGVKSGRCNVSWSRCSSRVGSGGSGVDVVVQVKLKYQALQVVVGSVQNVRLQLRWDVGTTQLARPLLALDFRESVSYLFENTK